MRPLYVSWNEINIYITDILVHPVMKKVQIIYTLNKDEIFHYNIIILSYYRYYIWLDISFFGHATPRI